MSQAHENSGDDDSENGSTPDTRPRISISIDRCRARQFDLTVNGLSYGEYMHLGNAKMLAEFAQGLLLDLQAAGIIGQSFVITTTINPERTKDDDAVS